MPETDASRDDASLVTGPPAAPGGPEAAGVLRFAAELGRLIGRHLAAVPPAGGPMGPAPTGFTRPGRRSRPREP
jgi:hypothetical protein